MIYCYERSEITRCADCDFSSFGGNLKWGQVYCSRKDEIIERHKTPQENECPMTVIIDGRK